MNNNNDDYGIPFMDIDFLTKNNNIENNTYTNNNKKKSNKKSTNNSNKKTTNNFNNNSNIDFNLFEDLSEIKIKNEFSDDFIENDLNKKNKIVSKNDNDEYLDRYNDVIKYPEGSYHPIDFDYHSPEACGISSKYINKNSSMSDGLRKNGILCDFSDYEKYSRFNPISELDKEKIKNARKKACNCEHQRMLTIKHYEKNKKSDTSHLFAYNLAKQKCLQCYIFEKDLLQNGYLTSSKDKVNIYDIVWNIVDFIIQNENNTELYNDADGDDNLEKIIQYSYANLTTILDKKYTKKQLNNIDFENFRKTTIILFYITKKDLIDKEIELEKESIQTKKKTKKSLQSNLDKLNKNEEEYRKYLEEMQLLKLKYMKNYVKKLKKQYQHLKPQQQAQKQSQQQQTQKQTQKQTQQQQKQTQQQAQQQAKKQTQQQGQKQTQKQTQQQGQKQSQQQTKKQTQQQKQTQKQAQQGSQSNKNNTTKNKYTHLL